LHELISTFDASSWLFDWHPPLQRHDLSKEEEEEKKKKRKGYAESMKWSVADHSQNAEG
tara:strand:+ start:588 stop:764 length:177 start_codon:yes stop_codon:yes gene_type:complete